MVPEATHGPISRTMPHHLAQLNIGRLVAPLDAPEIADFVAALDTINALADAAPGFVWRFQTEAGDATALRPYDDDRMIVNFSVWESMEALHQYVYRTAHAEVMARRREWFERLADAFMVLWWVPAGHQPSTEEAVARLDHLRAHGPSAHAFTFKQPFAP
jgi:heme-degrading monooxygenase HmoA